MADLDKELAAGRIAPVYYVCGEPFERDRAADAIRAAALAADPGTDVEVLDAKEAGPGRILDAARTRPMFGGRRLVVVRGAGALKAAQLKALIPYVEDPAPHAILLMVGDKADLRQRFFAALKKRGALHRFEALKERQAPRWVAGEARRRKIRLAPGAAERIADAVGADMGQLAGALERVALYAGPGAAVTPDDVEAVLAQTRQRSIFELTNAVGRGQRREALLVLRQMTRAREPGIRIVAMLMRHLRQLWSAAELLAEGAGEKTIAREVGIHPFFARDLIQQARRLDGATFRRTHEALCLADRDLKRSPLPDALILDRLVLKLVGG